MTIHVYNFQSTSGQFETTVIPAKGRSEKLMLEKFERWKLEDTRRRDEHLFRTFTKIIYIFGNGMNILKMCTSTPTKFGLKPGEIHWIEFI
ncbi:MAG: hypothetical protein IPJ13_09255 [Saprospiraceae bacterium]|nr:hypothetical protein [Saprospiraceae bacterium]